MTVLDESLIRDEMSELLRGREDVGVHVVTVDFGVGLTGTFVVELTRMSSGECGRCGQPLPTDSPGPVNWIDPRTGDSQGGYSHQHGCGEWNSPRSVERTLHASDFPDGTAEAAALSDVLRAMLNELDADVADAVASEVSRIRARLTRELREALTDLASGVDPEDIETGSEVAPGICCEGGQWMAWDYPPLAAEGDYIAVYGRELQAQAS